MEELLTIVIEIYNCISQYEVNIIFTAFFNTLPSVEPLVYHPMCLDIVLISAFHNRKS